jgi:hypothetical protein
LYARRLARHEQAPGEQAADGTGGADVERRRPLGSGIGAGEEPVHDGERPHGEVQVVRAAPEAVRKPASIAVRDREREQELGRDDSERGREGTVRSGAGNHQLCERERHVSIDEQCENVQRDERAGQQAEEAVHVLDREARPVAQLRAAGEGETGQDGEGQEPERDEPAGSGGVPLDERHAAAVTGVIASRQQAFATIPSSDTKRPGSRRSSSQSGPSSESRKAAFAATSASRQSEAATVTSRQRDRDGRPV